MRLRMRALSVWTTLIVLVALRVQFACAESDSVRHAISRFDFSLDGSQLAIVTSTWKEPDTPIGNRPDRIRLAIGLVDAKTLTDGTEVCHESKHGLPIRDSFSGWQTSFSPSGRYLYVLMNGGGPIHTWDTTTNQFIESRILEQSKISGFQLSANGEWLAYRTRLGREVRNLQTGRPLEQRIDLGWPILFSSDSKRLMSVKKDTIDIWNLSQQTGVQTFVEKDIDLGRQGCVAFSAHGTALAIRCNNGLWYHNLDTDEKKHLLIEHVEVKQTPKGVQEKRVGEMAQGVQFSPDEKLLAAWGTYGLKLFNIADDFALLRSVPYSSVTCLAFSPDSKTYATGDGNGKLAIYDTATGNELRSAVLNGDVESPPKLVRTK